MKPFKQSLRLALMLLLCSSTGLAEEVDAPGGRDHRMFSRMPGFFIDTFDWDPSSTYTFETEDGESTVSGRTYRIDYLLGRGEPAPAPEQIISNYTAAVNALGGRVLLQKPGDAVFRIEEEATEVWVHLTVWDGELYGLRIVESDIEPPRTILDPDQMAEALMKEGRLSIYGLAFDDSKPAVMPESGRILEVIADLLRQHPNLNLYIVGHTDNHGDFLGNLNRSKRQANVVVRDLLSDYGIPPGRLQPYGVGPLAPIASNDNEIGRALNRRLELVLR